jgi:carbon-monoxide dehydrogenase medium subunit
MIPAPFDYHRPGTLDEAIGLLSRHGPDAKVLAGGMSLLPALKLRLGTCGHLVDIGRIPGLEYVKEDGGTLRIGAGTRQCVLAQSETVNSRYGVLADAVPLIADPLVRNRGTFGGNVANGDPANDGPAIVIALGAELVVRGRQGERTVAANRFYKDLFVTALAPDEILTEIRIPLPPPRSGSAYRKLKRKTGDYAAAAARCSVPASRSQTPGPRRSKPSRRRASWRARRPTRRTSPRRRGSRRAPPRRAPTGEGRSSTSVRWRGC